MREVRAEFAAAVLGGWLYVMGGEQRWDDNYEILKAVERYNPVRNVWEAVADMNTLRYGCAAAVLDGKLYVLGGESYGDPVYDSGYLASVECYDVERNEWKLVGAMNHKRFRPAVAVLEGELYVMGGVGTRRNRFGGVLDSCEKYDVERDEWVLLEGDGATMRVARRSHVAVVL